MELNMDKYIEMIPLVLKVVTKIELEDVELHFVYGQEEYTKDLRKVKKQFKRQLKKTFREWQ
jgi:hypothetical protein